MLIVLIVAVVATGLTWRGHARFGAIADEQTTTLTVNVGGRFSLAVPDRGASVGDHWTASADPAGLVELVEKERMAAGLWDQVFGPSLDGGAGSRYFRYDAKRPGQVTITLSNCFQGCRNDHTRAESKTLSWTVTIS